MNTAFLGRAISLVILLALAASAVFAQAQRKPLDDKDNPELIGKRDINKGQLDFYSQDKEAALGRQLPPRLTGIRSSSPIRSSPSTSTVWDRTLRCTLTPRRRSRSR